MHQALTPGRGQAATRHCHAPLQNEGESVSTQHTCMPLPSAQKEAGAGPAQAGRRGAAVGTRVLVIQHSAHSQPSPLATLMAALTAKVLTWKLRKNLSKIPNSPTLQWGSSSTPLTPGLRAIPGSGYSAIPQTPALPHPSFPMPSTPSPSRSRTQTSTSKGRGT